MFALLTKPLRAGQPVPVEHRANFWALYMDIAWAGILNGTSLGFLSVYAAHLNASAFQIGLLNAGPALVGLLFTLPAGRWLQKGPVGGAVFWSSLFARVGYLLWALLPFLFTAQMEIWALVVLVLVQTIPGTVLAVGFNALYASAVPPAWRGHVVGLRNALFSLVLVLTALGSGWLLNHLPFPLGYQLIFVLGFLGAGMSSYYLWQLRHITGETVPGPPQIRGILGDFARPGEIRIMGVSLRADVALRAVTRGVNLLRPEVLRGEFRNVLAAVFIFHVAQFVPIPLFSLFWVNQAHFSDGLISVATACFHGMVLLGSLQISRLVQRWGNHSLIVTGALLLSLFPIMTAYATSTPLFLATNLLGGLAWSLVAGSIGNYLLEKVPATDRPPYLAWYNLALNAAVLLGSLTGPLLAVQMGLVPALIVSALLRALAAVAIWKLG